MRRQPPTTPRLHPTWAADHRSGTRTCRYPWRPASSFRRPMGRSRCGGRRPRQASATRHRRKELSALPRAGAAVQTVLPGNHLQPPAPHRRAGVTPPRSYDAAQLSGKAIDLAHVAAAVARPAVHRQRRCRGAADQRAQPRVGLGRGGGRGAGGVAGDGLPAGRRGRRGFRAARLAAESGRRHHRAARRVCLDVRDAGQRHGAAGDLLRALLPVARRPRGALLFAAARLHGGDARRGGVGQPGAAGGVLGADQRLLLPAHRLLARTVKDARRGARMAFTVTASGRPGAAGRRAAARATSSAATTWTRCWRPATWCAPMRCIR